MTLAAITITLLVQHLNNDVKADLEALHLIKTVNSQIRCDHDKLISSFVVSERLKRLIYDLP